MPVHDSSKWSPRVRSIGCRCRQLAAALGVGLVVWSAGCQVEPATSTFNLAAMHDDQFARGGDREPSAETLYRLGKLLRTQQKHGEAAAVLRQCIQRYPSYAPATCELAGLYISRRELGRAMDLLEDALRMTPDDPVLLNDLGMCYFLAEDYQLARHQFARAVRSWPDNARLTSNLAMATGMLGAYDDCLTIYQHIVPARQAHHNLAVICEARQDNKRAAIEFAKAAAVVDAESDT